VSRLYVETSEILLLVRPSRPSAHQQGNIRDRELLRKRFELGLLSLHRDQFPNSVATASDPDRWWPDTVDFLVFGLEAMLRKGGKGAGQTATDRSPADSTTMY
jgi:hypothetical protein